MPYAKQTGDELGLKTLVWALTRIFLVFFVVNLAHHFLHGYMHGVSDQPKEAELRDICANSAAAREKWSHDCAHLVAMRGLGPLEAGWVEMYKNAHLCGPVPCLQLIESLGVMVFGAAAVALTGAYIVYRYAGSQQAVAGPVYQVESGSDAGQIEYVRGRHAEIRYGHAADATSRRRLDGAPLVQEIG